MFSCLLLDLHNPSYLEVSYLSGPITLIFGFFHFRVFSKYFWLGGAAPRPPQFLAGGAKPPQIPPLNDRSSHLIEAAKRGRLDQMIFFSAPLTTRAPPTTVRRPSDDRPPAVRQPSTVPMILRYLGANLRAGANFKNLPLTVSRRAFGLTV